MSSKKMLVIVEPTSEGLWAYIPDLQGCVSEGKDFAELKENLREGLELHIEGLKEDGEPFPVIGDFDRDIDYKFDLSTFFKEFPISISGISQKSGINRSLLSQYVSGLKPITYETTLRIQEAIKSIAQEISSIHLV